VLIVSGLSGELAAIARRVSENPYLAFLVYVALVGVLGLVVSLPLNFYSGFVIEHRYGLSNQGLGRWLLEEVKGLAVGGLIAAPLLLAFYFFLRTLGQWWWLAVGALVFAFSILLSKLAPVILFPLFYKLERVEDGVLRERLARLCAEVGLNVEAIFRFNLSKNTRKANAAFTGLGKTKRILLGDTLLENFSQDEVVAVFAHELGHYKYGHLWKGIGLGLLNIVVGLYLTHRLYAASQSWLGVVRLDELAALPLLGFYLILFALVSLPLQNAWSRRCEREADRFAVEITEDGRSLISALEKLGQVNLADSAPHPITEFVFYSHPAMGKRIEAAKTLSRSLHRRTSL